MGGEQLVKRILRYVPAAIVIVAMALILGSMITRRSPIYDERYHTLRGLVFWWEGDARLSSPHPPLGNALAALPAAIARPSVDFTKLSGWEIRNKLRLSNHLFALDYEAARTTLMWCRAGMCALAVLFAVYFYAFCCSFFGRRAALCALVLLAFNPSLLAQAGVMTTDFPATAGAFVMVGEFARYLRAPSFRRVLILGLVVGMATMAKYTLFGVVVLVLLFWLAWTAFNRELGGRSGRRKWLRFVGELAVVGVVSLTVINVSYRFDRTGWSAERILTTLPGGTKSDPGLVRKVLAALPGATPVPVPYTLLEGLSIVAGHVEREQKNASYFMGEVGSNGWRSYFPIMLGIKTPLPVLALLLVALVLGLAPPRRPSPTTALFLWVSLGFLLMLLPSRMNIGVRHALPIVPFLTAFAGIGASELIDRLKLAPCRLSRAALALPLLGLPLMPVIALTEFPDYFGYFNALVGRTRGHTISIVGEDGGQDAVDLARLAKREKTFPLYYTLMPKLARFELERKGVEFKPLECAGRLPKQPAFMAVHVSYLLRRPECYAFAEWAEERYVINDHIRVYYVDPAKAPRKTKSKAGRRGAEPGRDVGEAEDELGE